MTNRRFHCALLIAALAMLPAAPLAAQSAQGKWLTDDGSAIVRIGRCGETLCGVIERVLDPEAPENDINNPDPKKRSKPLVGTYVLRGFSGAGSKWEDGKAYDPKSGNSYRSKLEALDNGKLKVTGCVLLICRSRLWTRPT